MLTLAQTIDFHHAWHNATTLHPLGLTAVILLGVAMLAVPRRWAIAPMIVMACFVAPAQRVVLFNLDFTLLRLLVLFAWARIILWQEWRHFRWNALDFAVIAWAVVKVIAYATLRADVRALIYMLGSAYDIIGMYFFFRCIIRDWADIARLGWIFAVVAVPVAGAFVVEKATGRNAFSIFGGVPIITEMREGKIRAQGAYPHAIIAGCFWASVMPLIAALWWVSKRARWAAVGGVAGALVVVVACASTTPLAAVAAAIFGAGMVFFRQWLPWLRFGAVAMLVFLHLAMMKPVWHLISRVDLVGGSTGWHRYHLIDQAIRRFDEWALMGTLSTAHWGWGLQDVTNQYVLAGVRGGVLALALLVLTLTLAFWAIGRAWRAANTKAELALAWAVGVSLFVHAVSFIAVSYFGQAEMVWYLTLALAGSLWAMPRVQQVPVGQAPVRQAPRLSWWDRDPACPLAPVSASASGSRLTTQDSRL